MFQIDEKYSGKDKKNTIGFMKGKEKKRQELRKKAHPISRELDNYFCSIHKRGWWPNGRFNRKKYYYYADPGLGCYYEKNNVEQLKDLRDIIKETEKQKLKKFVEYNYIEDNQYIITIEYCANCEEHLTYTFHRADLYKNYALSLQKCILLRFPFINVILKPIDTDILKEEHYKLPEIDMKGDFKEIKFVNDKFKAVRIGAFEIQLCFKKNNEVKTALLYSKLKSKNWPKIPKILDKIVSYLPTFNGEIITYEKEEDKNILNNLQDSSNNINKNGLMEGLQINIYLLNNNKITQISKEAWDDVQKQQDPHKRQLMFQEQKIKNKENMFKLKNQSSFKQINNHSRPMSSLSIRGKLNKSNSMKNIRPSSSGTMHNISHYNNNSLFQSSINNIISPKNDYILNKNISNSLKGKLIITKYTNNNGIINIGPLPYDSYFIEIQESKQYRSVGVKLVFNSLFSLNPKNKNYIKKYIGLFTQENSFIQLHVYEVNKDKNGCEDPIHLAKAKVTLKKINDYEENNENISQNENNEKSFNLNEKLNTPGIFENTILPGKYLLQVEKTNYETVRKFIDLEKGFNSINVEMNVERCCNLHIFIYNYEKFQEELYIPIQNVDVSIYQNSNEILEESITDNKGEVNYIVNKGEDFLTIVVSKLGYYPVQRVFIRNKETPVNEKGEYEENLIFFLVKENFILENKCILCVTYSSLTDVNFDPNAIQISDNLKNKISLSCFDGQKENGIISTFIKYQNRKNNNSNENSNRNEEDNTTNIINNYDSSEIENYDNIISLSFIIQTEALKNNSYQDKGFSMNGLERYGCQTIIYTPKNMFYLNAPNNSKEGYNLWNLGWVDVKNLIFYQTNILSENVIDRSLYFDYWIEFLQSIIDNKIYTKLFEFFKFDKSVLVNNDRFINENLFVDSLKQMKLCAEKENEIILFVENVFKNNNQMVSFSLLKKKIASNLKNFMDNDLDNKIQEDTSVSYTKPQEENNVEEGYEEANNNDNNEVNMNEDINNVNNMENEEIKENV